ncbi:MAG: methylenetetrahydrofolate--tRNA-(uracil(54)-C(5))-methyltransferase (FADH(2)-oxidizing) TrmFO [Syntrophales bacterium]|jgi:methylenetetrahydrofolate--tRNA-(uracil-5-)-methyltransferase|nr:methylenetetrahydrofolate--tRNA-(uracil(54)-C(5))-methyltransferase (FADH(2)-oxidizing) TrmFO [Syntrophales bacterium]MCK9391271.1 methylenetetrahydrofolate--tRNA-(uracil(54)-C(5))-methyltransferase (FADH(2)-oxidizing) TrmFO [Syntrophales bacterium]
MRVDSEVTVIGGGLAGCEAAWQMLNRGCRVTMYEMKPERFSPAHTSPLLSELVCSNSLRSNALESAVGLLKQEMRCLGSLFVEGADKTTVPAGKSLAVDRRRFSEYIQDKLLSFGERFRLVHQEVEEIPRSGPVVIATGPLTSDALAKEIQSLTGSDYLYFYDAISPIVTADSIDAAKTFWASRYQEGDGDYLNCPLDEPTYTSFREAVLNADKISLRDFEKPRYFEGCLPIEILAERGDLTLLFGPMKPVGLTDPRTGRQPHAVVQLRKENQSGTLLNMVGFQTKLTWPEQRRIFRMIPGLENAEFARYGSIHRNTFIHSPALLNERLQLLTHPWLFFAGQLAGVEGYVESAAMGLFCGLSISHLLEEKDLLSPPDTTALGALIRFITTPAKKEFQPMNINHGIFRPLEIKIKKRERGKEYARRSLADLHDWMEAERCLSPLKVRLAALD